MKTVLSLVLVVLVCAVLGTLIGLAVGHVMFPPPEPIVLPSPSTDSHGTLPYFIHPSKSMCRMVVGNNSLDMNELHVYLCETAANKFYYVRVTPATAAMENSAWLGERNAE